MPDPVGILPRNVPADLCDNCGEYYQSGEITDRVSQIAQEAVSRGAVRPCSPLPLIRIPCSGAISGGDPCLERTQVPAIGERLVYASHLDDRIEMREDVSHGRP